VEAAEADGMIIRGTRANHANRAGSFLVSGKQPDGRRCGPAPQKTKEEL
jgi:hypothetical protein